jgi:hypothetical protein
MTGTRVRTKNDVDVGSDWDLIRKVSLETILPCLPSLIDASSIQFLLLWSRVWHSRYRFLVCSVCVGNPQKKNAKRPKNENHKNKDCLYQSVWQMVYAMIVDNIIPVSSNRDPPPLHMVQANTDFYRIIVIRVGLDVIMNID